MIAALKQRRHTLAMRFLLETAKRIECGHLTIRFSRNDETHEFVGAAAGPHGEIVIHDERVAQKTLVGGMLGFNEAYDDGWVDSPDLDAFYTLVLMNERALADRLAGKWWYNAATWVIHKLRPNTKRGARKNISAHYDLGNSFYERWLDKTMTYSSALFKRGDETLEEAQKNKYANLAKMMDIRPEHHVLEIGCGWGGFMEFVARDIGAKITGITISREQFDYATKRIADAGLQKLADVKLVDYRDIKGQFDRIASIEMFEAVGEKYWPTYFKTIRDRLKPGGRAALQIITIDPSRFDMYRKTPDYIQKYIFPGGMLPTVDLIKTHAQKAALQVGSMVNFGHDYARTLREWNKKFQSAWPHITGMESARRYDGRFKRMWEQYLAYCAAGFQCKTIDVVQCELVKPHNDDKKAA